MPNDRAVTPEVLERRIAAEIDKLPQLPTPTESELPLVDEIGGLGYAQLGTGALQNLAVTLPKIAPGSAGQVLLTDSNPSAAWTSLSGDVTVNSSGVTAITAGAVLITDLNTGTGELAGVWTSATITTRGNISGVQAATIYYLRVGKTFHFQVSMPTGNTATAAGAITFTIPSSITAARTQVLNGRTSNTIGLCTVSGGVITMTANATGGNFTAGQALGTVNIGATIEIA